MDVLFTLRTQNIVCHHNDELTVSTMQLDSKMAPQHPKKAIKNIADPMTMKAIGATLTFTSLNASRTSSYFNRNPTPTATKAIPHSCKKRGKMKELERNRTTMRIKKEIKDNRTNDCFFAWWIKKCGESVCFCFSLNQNRITLSRLVSRAVTIQRYTIYIPHI